MKNYCATAINQLKIYYVILRLLELKNFTQEQFEKVTEYTDLEPTSYWTECSLLEDLMEVQYIIKKEKDLYSVNPNWKKVFENDLKNIEKSIKIKEDIVEKEFSEIPNKRWKVSQEKHIWAYLEEIITKAQN